MRALGVVVFNVVLDAFTQFLDIIGGIDFSLSILSFSKKTYNFATAFGSPPYR